METTMALAVENELIVPPSPPSFRLNYLCPLELGPSGFPLALMSQEDMRVDQGSHFLPRLPSPSLRCPFWLQDAFVVLTGLRSDFSYL